MSKEGVVLLIRDNNNRVLLAKRGSQCKGYSNHWEFPGETLDEDDKSWRNAASRGSWEELGLYIENTQWKLVTVYESDRWLGRIYTVNIGTRTPRIAEPELCDDLQFVALDTVSSYSPLTPDTYLILERLNDAKEDWSRIYDPTARAA